MSVLRSGLKRLGAASALSLLLVPAALAQTTLPSVTVTDPLAKPKPKAPPPLPKVAATPPARPSPPPRSGPRPVASRTPPAAASGRRPSGTATSAGGGGSGALGAARGSGGTGAGTAAQAAASVGEAQAQSTRERIFTPAGANVTTIGKAGVDTLPQGSQTKFDRVVLQLPGVSQDSAASGDFHIRNEHANVQYRINGVLLPDGVSGFSQVLDSSFIRTLSLVDGALPAQYGLHTAGIFDITSRNGADAPGTTVTGYGGSRGTIIPTIETAGVSGRWDYFFTGRYVTDQIGVENPTPNTDAIHDRTRQGRYFAYASTPLDDGTRFIFMSGATVAKYQIPTTSGQMPQFTAFGTTNFDSSMLNENQVEHSIFNVVALQKSAGQLDAQISYFQRYSTLHFVPDQIGDLVFNGIASDVTRTSFVNGLQGDAAYRLDARQTVRFGFTGNVERAQAINLSTVLPTDADGNPIDAPFGIADPERKTGFVGGIYVQDEYRLTRQLTLNAGLRFDAINQYVTTNQLSPRASLVYTPVASTVFHVGYARYFTPPELALSTPTQLQPFANTTAAPDTSQDSAVRPERSHFFDVGVTHQVTPALSVGVDGYYKIAKNLLDDGQFGQALVLTAFNYDHAFNDGVEFKATYQKDGFRAYANVAAAQQRAKQVTSNQYLFGSDELVYIANNYVFTDHDQLITVSGGASYKFGSTTISTDVIYGSGLRNGFANTGTVTPYATINLGLTQEFQLVPDAKPTTVRFAMVNLLDHSYEIRDGSGIGVFAPQYGQRRGLFASLSQRF